MRCNPRRAPLLSFTNSTSSRRNDHLPKTWPGFVRLRSFSLLLGPIWPMRFSGIVEAVALGLESAPSSLIHGDLKPDHILIDGDRVALIDFDLFGAADPVVDVAHLLAFLGKPQERSRSRREETEDVGQIFVDEYFRHVPDSWRARLPLHHAMTSIHRAVGLCRRRGADHQHLVEDVLREGQAFLERGADGSVPSYKRRLTRSAVH